MTVIRFLKLLLNELIFAIIDMRCMREKIFDFERQKAKTIFSKFQSSHLTHVTKNGYLLVKFLTESIFRVHVIHKILFIKFKYFTF